MDAGTRRRSTADDLFPRLLSAAARPVAERPAVCGGVQRVPLGDLLLCRLVLLAAVAAALRLRDLRDRHEERLAPPPRAGGRDREARASAGLAAIASLTQITSWPG